MKQQGKRSDTPIDSHQTLANLSRESKRNIAYFIRLTHLIPTLLEMVDQGELPFRVGVDLSYLSPEKQQLVQDISVDCERKISTVQSGQIKKAYHQDNLTEEVIIEILEPEPKWNPYNALSSSIRSYMPKEATSKDIKAVLELIETYFKERSQG